MILPIRWTRREKAMKNRRGKSNSSRRGAQERARWRLRLLANIDHLMKKMVYIFDVDGTVLLEGSPISGAREFIELIRSLGKKTVFLTNNTSLTSDQHLHRILDKLELSGDNVHVYSALDFLLSELRKRRIRRIYPLFNRNVVNYLEEKGVVVDYSRPQAVVVGFDTELTYEKLSKACTFVQKNTPWILAHPDMRCPVVGGYVPDAGSLGLVIREVTGKRPTFVGGKPNPRMLLNALRLFKIHISDACFFGDRTYTDLKMGLQARVQTVHLLTGESTFEDFERFCNSKKCGDNVLLGEDWIVLRKIFIEHLRRYEIQPDSRMKDTRRQRLFSAAKHVSSLHVRPRRD